MDFSIYSKNGLISAQDAHRIFKGYASAPAIFLDATFTMPHEAKNPPKEFKKSHIPGAQFFDIDHAFADQNSDLPHMLCDQIKFELGMSDMGITRENFVIIYGQSGSIMGPARAWWSLKVFGHDRVAVLDGGLPAWIKAGLPLSTGETIKRPPAVYKSAPAMHLVRNKADVYNSLENKTQILDARPAPRFNGTAPEPRPGLKSGHIPFSLNIPSSEMIDPTTGLYKSPETLRKIFADKGYKSGQQTILSCGSGVTACALALALHNIGEQNWSVYDGSWSEWGLNAQDNPVSL